MEDKKDITLPDVTIMDNAVDDYLEKMRECFPVTAGTANTEVCDKMILSSRSDEEPYSNCIIDTVKQLLTEHGMEVSEGTRGVLVTAPRKEVASLAPEEDPFVALSEEIGRIRKEFKSRKKEILKELAKRSELAKTRHAAITGKRSDKSYIPPHQLNKSKHNKKGK